MYLHMKSCHYLIPILFSCLVLSCYLCRPVLGQVRNSNSTLCFDRERKALLDFKNGVRNDTCGMLTSWGETLDCCQWPGVSCSNDTGHVIILRVDGYDADGYCLEGNVSSSLTELEHLRHLNLSFNLFSQVIPSFLGSLPNLERLSLSEAGFIGEIPPQLGNLTKLTTLDIRSDFSPLYVQSLQWLSRLTFVRFLDLGGVDLSKATNWMHIVSNLPFLDNLQMSTCGLSAEITSPLTYSNSSSTLGSIDLSWNNLNNTRIFEWLLNMSDIATQLEYLDLSVNDLQVPFPSGLRNMPKLTYLDLSNNDLEGVLPSEFLNMSSLTYLGLYGNNLQGSVSKSITKLCNLQQLDLWDNNFDDELSDVIHAFSSCENKSLRTLNLNRNQFWGAVPDSISSLSSLTELHLHQNQLNGEISPGIGHLTMLEILDISSNSLETTLTDKHFSNLSRLRELVLSNNPRLVINADGNWNPPFQLNIVRLRSCNLGPRFPKWLQMQTNFSYFDVSNAGISDSIPVPFWNTISPNALELNMSHNRFYGTLRKLPNELRLRVVDLSSNLFEGAVPSLFSNVDSLYLNDNRFSDCSVFLCPKTATLLSELDLSSNLFSGELPDCWVNFPMLNTLNLENNRFSKNIPKSFGTLKYLQYLRLHNNSFSGPLPTSLQNCTSMSNIDLGYNLLNGYIPPWIGNAFRGLAVLILRQNRFVGEIPLSLCQLTSLQTLDLAKNRLSGEIPDCIGNFTAMTRAYNELVSAVDDYGVPYKSEEASAVVSWKRKEYRFTKAWGLIVIDLSSNDLHGEIPDDITWLVGLLSLDLSKNKLSGNIPSEIGNLTALELLDLSDNHLSGEIPLSLSKLTTLAVLDVSNNNLFGEIPVSTQLQGFDALSYMGNPGLCGAPLPKCSGNQPSSTRAVQEDEKSGIFPGLYISVVLGVIVGFWGVCGTLFVKTSWRHAYFCVVDNIKDRVCATTTSILAKAWRTPRR